MGRRKRRTNQAPAVSLAKKGRLVASRPDRETFRDLPVRTFTDWSVDNVRSALRDFEQGVFTRAAMLADAMTRDDRIGAVLDTRGKGVLGLPFEMDGGGRRHGAVAKRVLADWWTMVPEDELSDLLRWGHLLGVGLGELQWELGDNWTPRLKVWHPQYLEYRWAERRWYVYTQDGPVPIEPGDPKWVLYTPGGGQRPWMGGLIRRLAIPWLVRQFAARDWARYSEVHGLPIRKARIPANAAQADKDYFLDAVSNLGNEPTILTPITNDKDGKPIGFDVALEEAKGDSWEGFERLLSKMETNIAIAVLGQNLTTEVQGGSYAAATAHERVRQDYLEADAEQLSTALHDQILVPWATFNLGDPDLAPWPRWDASPPEDKAATAETWRVTGEAIRSLRSAGLNVDRLALAEQHGIPLVAGEPLIEPKDEPPEIRPQELSRLRLASGDPPASARGFLRGQIFTDAVGDQGKQLGRDAVAPDLAGLLDVVAASGDFDQLRQGLMDRYGEMTPQALAAVTEKALILAELAGRYAVLDDL